eukprot:11616883-Ditylum_brightwellii.AAC.1
MSGFGEYGEGVDCIVLINGSTKAAIALLLGEKTPSLPCAMGRVARGGPVVYVVGSLRVRKSSDVVCHVEWKAL